MITQEVALWKYRSTNLSLKGYSVIPATSFYNTNLYKQTKCAYFQNFSWFQFDFYELTMIVCVTLLHRLLRYIKLSGTIIKVPGGGHSYICMCCFHQAGLQISPPKHWPGAGENSNPNHGLACEMGTLFTDQLHLGSSFHWPVAFGPFGHPFHWLTLKSCPFQLIYKKKKKKKKFNQSLSWIYFLY